MTDRKTAKPRALSVRAAAKRIRELEASVKELEDERKRERSERLVALGVDEYIDDKLHDIVSRLEDLESRFW